MIKVDINNIQGRLTQVWYPFYNQKIIKSLNGDNTT